MIYLSHKILENQFPKYWFNWILKITKTEWLFKSQAPFTMLNYNRELFDQHQSLANICRHPYLSCEIIESNIDYNWCWSQVSNNPNITWEFITKHLDKPWNWRNLSKHPNITWEIIQNNPEFNWYTDRVSQNPNITWDIIQNNPDYNWNYFELSSHPNITWEIIKQTDNCGWNIHKICENPNITWDVICKETLYQWNWCKLAKHPNVPFNAIKQKILNVGDHYMPLEYITWFTNPTITETDIIDILNSSNKNAKKCICWDSLQYNKSISWDFIKTHRNIFSIGDAEVAGIPKPISNVAFNPNITGKIVNENPDWNWNSVLLTKNPMPKWKDEWILDQKNNHMAAMKIQRNLRNCNYNPKFKLAQRNIQRFYNELFEDL
jgi:hypothetical protein